MNNVVNLNDTIKFKLTDYGKQQARAFYNKLFSYYPEPKRSEVVAQSLTLWEPKEDGYSRAQLWVFIDTFGSLGSIAIGHRPVVEHNEVLIDAN